MNSLAFEVARKDNILMADFNTDEILKSLEELYLKKNYEEASTLLIKNKSDLDTGLFHYNLGTVYAKWGNLAAGRYHIEKSIKSGFVNSASLNNNQFIKEQLALDDLNTSKSLNDQWMDFSLALPLGAYFLFALTLSLIAVGWKKFNKDVNSYVLAFLLILGVAPLTYKLTVVDKVNYAVLLEEGAVREGPSRIFDQKAALNPGTKVIITKYDNGWYFISNPIHLSGWIERKNLGIY
jgi:hypothetical protein